MKSVVSFLFNEGKKQKKEIREKEEREKTNELFKGFEVAREAYGGRKTKRSKKKNRRKTRRK